ncbi:jg164, partial [Pararge aegeria aegeria]
MTQPNIDTTSLILRILCGVTFTVTILVSLCAFKRARLSRCGACAFHNRLSSPFGDKEVVRDSRVALAAAFVPL